MEKILMVDDDDLMLKIATKFLQKEGYDVIVAGNGRDAMKIIHEASVPFELIISDVIMPYSSGFELVSTLKKHSLYCNIPVIIISSSGNETIVKEAYQLGVDDFLKKPIMPQELLVRVKKILSRPQVNIS